MYLCNIYAVFVPLASRILCHICAIGHHKTTCSYFQLPRPNLAPRPKVELEGRGNKPNPFDPNGQSGAAPKSVGGNNPKVRVG